MFEYLDKELDHLDNMKSIDLITYNSRVVFALDHGGYKVLDIS